MSAAVVGGIDLEVAERLAQRSIANGVNDQENLRLLAMIRELRAARRVVVAAAAVENAALTDDCDYLEALDADLEQAFENYREVVARERQLTGAGR